MSTTPNLSVHVHDPEFVDKIIFEVKRQGHFDSFRKECLADVDTQPAYQNLHSRVEDSVQSFLNRQVWTPETNRNRLREDMKSNITRAGYLSSGVSRIVDQIVEQKMDYIQSKVEEILYKYVGIEQPTKQIKQENGTLEVDTNLLPTDLEQVSPDSDKKSIEESRNEEVEEEIIDDDDDFESPAFEPVEPMTIEKNDHSQLSNLSAISGLTSQDSQKSEQPQTTVPEVLQDTQLSQISSTQDITQDPPGLCGEEAQMATGLNETSDNDRKPIEEVVTKTENELPEKSQFDLKKDSIEFTGTERKSIQLDDSTNSGETEKALQPSDVASTSMEVENLYENDTTDSSDIRMEIDLKEESTAASSKMEESSQESGKDKIQHKKEHRRDNHRSSSHKSRHHSSSSKSSRHDDKNRNRKDAKSSSSTAQKNDKDRSSSSRKDRERDKKDGSSRSASKQDHQEKKSLSDDHQQEKTTRRRRSTDHDSNEGKNAQLKTISFGENLLVGQSSGHLSSAKETSNVKQSSDGTIQQQNDTPELKPIVVDQMLNENCELSIDTKPTSSLSGDSNPKSSILVKGSYLKSTSKSSELATAIDEISDGCRGFQADELPNNPWFDLLRQESEKIKMSCSKQRISNNNYLDQKKNLNLELKLKTKTKGKHLNPPGESSTILLNGLDEITPEQKAINIAQQQRYSSDDLYKPRVDFGSRRRRGQVVETLDRSDNST